MQNDNNRQSPISEYLLKLQLIVSNTVFKNKTEANKYETLASVEAGDMYVHAVNKTDTFELYQYNSHYAYAELINQGYSHERATFLMNNPAMIPGPIKLALKIAARSEFLDTFVEENRYYQTLTGKPYRSRIHPSDNDPIICIPDGFYDRYKNNPEIRSGIPIHEMSEKYQELFMNSEFYQDTLNKYPNVEYLKYIGSNSIPLEVSRKARDGDILKINTNKLVKYHPTYGVITVSSDIVHKFVQVYNETRDYVYFTLRGEFQDIYPNYDEFMRFLTIYMTMGNCINEFMKNSTSLIHMNNVTANNLFNLYGLPSVIMEGTSMIEFLKKFRLLLMDKGTNSVYRVKDLIGYNYTDIYSLIMVKQQIFEDGKPVYVIDPDTGKYVPKTKIVFRRMNTNENTSYFKFKDEGKEYLERRFPRNSEDDITEERQISSGDPRWWESKEVNDALRDMNYTLSNSKYIQLSTHLTMKDIWFQTVILLRGLLDNRLETAFTHINVNYNVNGSTELSVFEAVLCLMIIMNWKLGFKGNMYLDNDPNDGRTASLDLLYNGLFQGILYHSGKEYKKNELVGEYGDNSLYLVKRDFVASTLEDDIKHGNLEFCMGFDALSPKELIAGKPFKIASFDFNLHETKPEFYSSLSTMDYLEPDKFIPMIDKVLTHQDANLGETIMIDVYSIYNYLENKLRAATTIEEYRQVTDAYNNLFLVDPIRDWYDEETSNFETMIMNEYEVSSLELMGLYNFFDNSAIRSPDFRVVYNNDEYDIFLYDVLNYDVRDLKVPSKNNHNGTAIFNDNEFTQQFYAMLKKYTSNELMTAPNFSDNLKDNYRNIIESKVRFDLTNSDSGPTDFESLLRRTNPSLAKYLLSLNTPENSEALVLLLRSLIKSLEAYTNTSLAALEFKSLGAEKYVMILKEVISYFKSYMVEFTKDEFIYMFDNILDNGGNSNMLKLMDKIVHMDLKLKPKDSLTLFDVGKFDIHTGIRDTTDGMLYDDAQFRMVCTYEKIKSLGYDIWYDDGKQITKTPFLNLQNETKIIANLVKNKSSEAYKIIINKNNIDVDNYYGNKRKIK